jgi:hypothetical protein
MNISVIVNGVFTNCGYIKGCTFKIAQLRDNYANFAKFNNMLTANSVIRDITLPIQNFYDCFECLSSDIYKTA